jgi:hypothetical protein
MCAPWLMNISLVGADYLERNLNLLILKGRLVYITDLDARATLLRIFILHIMAES